ncbi:hypothetical protein C8R47DRAFT_1317658 [Mycena vitilis]|nr:hypothetical protein C8R47DRAFT_1317658 [Mycena vitilis]
MRLISAIHVSAALLWTVCAVPILVQGDTPSTTGSSIPHPPSIASPSTNSDIFTTLPSATQTAADAQNTNTSTEATDEFGDPTDVAPPSEGAGKDEAPGDHPSCVIS